MSESKRRLIRGEYHPGNITTDEPFKQDDAPPMSERVVTTRDEPILYTHDGKPIYRQAGFRSTMR